MNLPVNHNLHSEYRHAYRNKTKMSAVPIHNVKTVISRKVTPMRSSRTMYITPTEKKYKNIIYRSWKSRGRRIAIIIMHAFI